MSDLVGNPEDRYSRVVAHMMQQQSVQRFNETIRDLKLEINIMLKHNSLLLQSSHVILKPYKQAIL